MNIEIVPRKDWGGADPKLTSLTKTRKFPLAYVFNNAKPGVCSNFETCRLKVQRLQTWDMSFVGDIRPNFIVCGDLRVYEGRGWSVMPGLNDDYREIVARSLYILFMVKGVDDLYERMYVPEDMISVANDLVLYGVEKGYIEHSFQRKDLY